MIQEKQCTKCGEVKPLSEFSKSKQTKDGLESRCKSCERKRHEKHRRSVRGLVFQIYSDQKKASIRRGHIQPLYTKYELLDFALKSKEFHELYSNWIKSNYNRWLAPSFDRADDYKPYSFENFNRWMTWEENADKGSADRKNGVNNKDSKAVIGTCIATGKVEEFYSTMDAERKTGCYHSHISQCCLGKKKTVKGFAFKYKSYAKS